MAYRSDKDYSKDIHIIGAAVTAAGSIIGFGGRKLAERKRKAAEIELQSFVDEYNAIYNNCIEMQEILNKNIYDIVLYKKRLLETSVKKFLKYWNRINIKSLSSKELEKDVESKAILIPLSEKDIILLSDYINAYSIVSDTYTERALQASYNLSIQSGSLQNFGASVTNVVKDTYHGDKESQKINLTNAKNAGLQIAAEYSVAATQYGLTGIKDLIRTNRLLKDIESQKINLERKTEELKLIMNNYQAIQSWVDINNHALIKINPLIIQYVDKTADIVDNQKRFMFFGKVDFMKIPKKDREIIGYTKSLITALAAIIKTPLLNENGTVYEGSKTEFNNVVNYIDENQYKLLTLLN